jgi:hypothetical protein
MTKKNKVLNFYSKFTIHLIAAAFSSEYEMEKIKGKLMKFIDQKFLLVE